MDPLSVAASVAGLLGLMIQVSQMLYEQAHTLKNAAVDVQGLLGELDLLRQILIKLETFLRGQALKSHLFGNTSVLINSIKGCSNKVSAIQLRLEKLGQKQSLAQIIERGKWYFERDEHQEIVTTLHRYLGIFQIFLSVGGM